MKKKWIYILSIILICICFTSCGKNDNPQEVIGAIKTNLETAESMDFDLHLVSDVIATYGTTKIPQKTEYKLNIKENASTAYITGDILTSMGTTNNKYPIEAYQTSANENYSLYFKEDGIWYRQDAESPKSFDMNVLRMFYDAGMTFKEETVTINEKECLQMSADVYGESAAEFASMFGITTSEDSKIGVIVYIYKDLNYPAYIKIDLKPSEKQVIKDSEMTTVTNNLYIELTFNSFNESEITLPEDIRKEAVKKQEQTAIQQEKEPIIQDGPEIEPAKEVNDDNTEQEFPDDTPEEVIEKISDEWNSFQFDYEGKIYRMPMAYKTFEPSGFSMIENERTMIMESGQDYTTSLYKEGYSIIVKLKNTGTTPKTLVECDIVSIDFDTYSLDSDQLAKFMFPNNVNFAATYDNIVELWEEPTELHDGTALKIATYQDGDNRVEIFLDPQDNTIIEYKITAN